MIKLVKTCPHCTGESVVSMSNMEFNEWQVGGTPIQQVFPDWTKEERELAMTGIHPECWDEIFYMGDDDEE